MGKEKVVYFFAVRVSSQLFWKFHSAGTYVTSSQRSNVQVTITVTCLNFAVTGSWILLHPLRSSRRGKPSRKIALNSNGEVNCRELARRPWPVGDLDFNYTLYLWYTLATIDYGIGPISSLVAHVCSCKLKKHKHSNPVWHKGSGISSEGGPKYMGVINFLERKIGGNQNFDDQNVGNHKMTTDIVFILFKKTDFNIILPSLGGTVYRWWRVIKFLLLTWGGGSFINADFL